MSPLLRGYRLYYEGLGDSMDCLGKVVILDTRYASRGMMYDDKPRHSLVKFVYRTHVFGNERRYAVAFSGRTIMIVWYVVSEYLSLSRAVGANLTLCSWGWKAACLSYLLPPSC